MNSIATFAETANRFYVAGWRRMHLNEMELSIGQRFASFEEANKYIQDFARAMLNYACEAGEAGNSYTAIWRRRQPLW